MDENPDLLYEENEVIWAKIRGYPWWPAYINEVLTGQCVSDYQYTEVSSRLGPSKLRKFFQNYSQCYSKSKSNKKLRQSVQKAEERLKQNSQDISMYENIRNELLSKKKKLTTEQSRLSSSEKEQKSEMPILSKRKTDDNYFSRNKGKEERNKQKLFEQSSSSLEKSEQPEKEATDRLRQSFTHLNKKSRSELVGASVNESKILLPPSRKVVHIRHNKNDAKMLRNKQQKEEPSDENQNMVSKEEEEQQVKQNLHDQNQINKQDICKAADQQKVSQKLLIKKGRRGRPPKLLQKKKQVQILMESEQESNDLKNSNPLHRKREDRRNKGNTLFNQDNQNSNQQATLNESDIIMINSCLDNPKQLAKVLIQMPITTANVKQILDLGVSTALQQGVCTKTIHVLLCMLKATLLHRYFPEDLKYRKKFQKLLKEKKKVYALLNGDDNQSDNGVMEDEKNDEKTEDKIQNQERLKHEQIRSKANIKLQKMIRKAGLNNGAKQLASEVENSFQLTADGTGQAYRSIAYERMRNLKTKLTYLRESQAKQSQIKQYVLETILSYSTTNTQMIAD